MIHNDFLKKVLSNIEESDFGPVHLSKEDVKLLYSLGYGFYQGGDLTLAETIFRRLVLADPLEKKHWWAFGAVLQAKKSYKEALTAWSMCCLLDDENPEGHFHAAECFLSLNHRSEALKALAAAKGRCQDKDQNLYKKVVLLEELWSQQ